MTAPPDSPTVRLQLDDQPSARSTRLMAAVVRVVVALLWIENLGWKRPPTFGEDTDPPAGLYKWVRGGVEYEVFAPWASLVENVIEPNFLFFAWFTFAAEACIGAFLLIGLATRFWALVGLVQTVAIMLSVLNAPHEWFWAYALMFAAHLALIAMAAGRAYGLDALLRPRWRRRGGLARLLMITS